MSRITTVEFHGEIPDSMESKSWSFGNEKLTDGFLEE